MKKFLAFLCAAVLVLGAINVVNASLIGATIEGEGVNFFTSTTFFENTAVVADGGTPEFSGSTPNFFDELYRFDIDFMENSVWVDVTAETPFAGPAVDLIFDFVVFVPGNEFALVDVVERVEDRTGVLGGAPADTIVTANSFTILMPGFILESPPGPGRFHFDIFTEPTAPIPEPSAILLLSIGLVGLVGFRRRFRE